MVCRPSSVRGCHISFSLIWCSALFGLATLPHLIAIFFPPPGHDGFGTIFFFKDFAVYESAMAEGARSSSWLIHYHFTPEAHQAAFMYPLYVGIGKLAAALGLPPMGVYRAVELVGRLTVLASLAWMTPRLLPGAGRLAVALATAGAGLGVWAMLAQVGAAGRPRTATRT